MPATQSAVLFSVPANGVERRSVRAFAKRLQSEVAKGACFNVLVTGDEELQRLNRRFRNKDYAADVLSFPAGESVQPGPSEFIGELAISYDRAAAQAGELGHDVAEEVSILILHGVLHLLGLDHERDSGEMARAETKWRKRYGLPLGLIERAQP